ncbi:hypothetical protein BC833DRAFT_620139 [Globomyces pollinis-pini]|nr:hypothetical protein BC833DRAFT_620139 [Globomyces pollinis-pini]
MIFLPFLLTVVSSTHCHQCPTVKSNNLQFIEIELLDKSRLCFCGSEALKIVECKSLQRNPNFPWIGNDCPPVKHQEAWMSCIQSRNRKLVHDHNQLLNECARVTGARPTVHHKLSSHDKVIHHGNTKPIFKTDHEDQPPQNQVPETNGNVGEAIVHKEQTHRLQQKESAQEPVPSTPNTQSPSQNMYWLVIFGSAMITLVIGIVGYVIFSKRKKFKRTTLGRLKTKRQPPKPIDLEHVSVSNTPVIDDPLFQKSSPEKIESPVTRLNPYGIVLNRVVSEDALSSKSQLQTGNSADSLVLVDNFDEEDVQETRTTSPDTELLFNDSRNQ